MRELPKRGQASEGLREPPLLLQLFRQAVFQLGADFGDFHSCAHQELATQKFVRLLFIRQLPDDAAILAILIPAEAAIGNRFRADVLEAAQNRVFFGNLKRFPKNLDLHQPFVRAKYLS